MRCRSWQSRPSYVRSPANRAQLPGSQERSLFSWVAWASGRLLARAAQIAAHSAEALGAIVLACSLACEPDRPDPVVTSRPAEPARPVEPPVEAPPATQPVDAPASEPPPAAPPPARDPNRARVEVATPADAQEGWLVIEALKPGAGRATATAVFSPLDNRLVIDTDRVHRFRLDLSELRINWDRRVVIRIDKISAQLSRKNWPVVHFESTPAGDWIVVAPVR